MVITVSRIIALALIAGTSSANEIPNPFVSSEEQLQCSTYTGHECGPGAPCRNGQCCSQYGYCGMSAQHCGVCCQNGPCTSAIATCGACYNGFASSPDCTGYYNCGGSSAHGPLMNCPAGTLWNSAISACDYSYNVVCPCTAPAPAPPVPRHAGYCAFAADYNCYHLGWPGCCLNDAVVCPGVAPACDASSGRHSSSSSHSRRYTYDSVRFVQTGSADSECLDVDGYPYTYGVFTNIASPNECAKYCVQIVSSDLLHSLEGFEYDSSANCRCLYDEFALNGSDKIFVFDYVVLNSILKGSGPVYDTGKLNGSTCYARVYDEGYEEIESYLLRGQLSIS